MQELPNEENIVYLVVLTLGFISVCFSLEGNYSVSCGIILNLF